MAEQIKTVVSQQVDTKEKEQQTERKQMNSVATQTEPFQFEISTELNSIREIFFRNIDAAMSNIQKEILTKWNNNNANVELGTLEANTSLSNKTPKQNDFLNHSTKIENKNEPENLVGEPKIDPLVVLPKDNMKSSITSNTTQKVEHDGSLKNNNDLIKDTEKAGSASKNSNFETVANSSILENPNVSRRGNNKRQLKYLPSSVSF